ncbi:hypothetical protein BV22DRAFT_667847 [Leucogyrophana mollusca]|uniref:Uncharacterized protein n=1 Tax=Leucogyrophana mollusca TaxID=85980 RepID=A0ACB8B9P0_9AGAM|nr:hypothetical protein BV22DRAFT_667847 [Leucogyrophana mollusca]
MKPASSLIPGYRQVESFGADDEYEEEEISYITLDLGVVEPTLVPSSSTYRLIGLDTPTPFLQLSGSVLKGKHDTLLGTELLFTEEKPDSDRHKRSVVHVANTEQRVIFREVELKPKPDPSSQPEAQGPDTRPSETTSTASAVELPATNQTLERITGNSTETRTRKRGKKKKGQESENPSGQDAMDTS